MTGQGELERIRARYERRKTGAFELRYSPLMPHAFASAQEKRRRIVEWIERAGLFPVEDKRLLEVGCGDGSDLLDFIRLGFRPENLVASELLSDRVAVARHRLPAAVSVVEGDATQLDIPSESFDVVCQSMVFTSILEDAFRRRLAERMWSLVRPGGGILWYDFVFDNPANPDVRGVPLHEVRALFPKGGEMITWRLTLAPPISRVVARIHPNLYVLFDSFPFLRTHVLCWIRKPEENSAAGVRTVRQAN